MRSDHCVFMEPVVTVRHVIETKKKNEEWSVKMRIKKIIFIVFAVVQKNFMITVTVLMSIGFIMMRQVPVGRIILACVWVFHILLFCFGIKTLNVESKDSEVVI